MTGKRDLFDLHPIGIIGAAAAGRPDHASRRLEAVADAAPELERASVQRRLLAVLSRRLDSPRARGAPTERAL